MEKPVPVNRSPDNPTTRDLRDQPPADDLDPAALAESVRGHAADLGFQDITFATPSLETHERWLQQWLADWLESDLFKGIMQKWPVWQDGDEEPLFPPQEAA